MNVLILVMSARLHPYGALMDAQIETWDSEENENAETLYYCENVGQSSERIYYSQRWSSDLVDVSSRTIEAFEVSLERDWDYLARPHSSTYVHKRNLVSYCETLPKENVVCGCMTTGDSPFLWGGCHYIFSRNVIEKFVARKDKWNRHVMEDQSISQMVRELELPVIPARSATINMMPGYYTVDSYGIGENFVFTDWDDINRAQPHFFFRCKQDGRREEDIRIFRELKLHYT